MPDELYGAICNVIPLFLLLESPLTSVVYEIAATLFCCEAPEMSYETSPDFPLARGWVDNDRIYISRCFYPLMLGQTAWRKKLWYYIVEVQRHFGCFAWNSEDYLMIYDPRCLKGILTSQWKTQHELRFAFERRIFPETSGAPKWTSRPIKYL